MNWLITPFRLKAVVRGWGWYASTTSNLSKDRGRPRFGPIEKTDPAHFNLSHSQHSAIRGCYHQLHVKRSSSRQNDGHASRTPRQRRIASPDHFLVGQIHGGVLPPPPPWTLSHPDFLDQGVPVSENPKFPEKILERSARFGQFSHFKGQKHPKNF